MSFLFCSWATNDEGKKDAEIEEEDDQLKESKNYFLEKSLGTIEKPVEKEKTINQTPVKNGDDLSKEELINEPVQNEKKPFFVMWNTQEEAEEDESKSDDPEDNEKDQTMEKSNSSEAKPVSPEKSEVSPSKDKEANKDVKISPEVEDKPMFFACPQPRGIF